MNTQHKFIMPTAEEDAAINAAIASDPDTFEADPTNMFRTTATTPQGIIDDIARQARGKPRRPTKQATTIRLPAEVIEYFKRGGKGWQTRISDALSEFVAKRG